MPSERDGVAEITRTARHRELSLQETICLALLVLRNWDRASQRYGDHPSAEQVAEFAQITDGEWLEFRAEAALQLAEFAARLPRIGDSWWRGFWQGFAASWFYAFTIALTALIIKLSGSDVITLARELLGPSR